MLILQLGDPKWRFCYRFLFLNVLVKCFEVKGTYWEYGKNLPSRNSTFKIRLPGFL